MERAVTGETTFFGGSGNDARNVTVRECDGFANQKLAIERRGSDKQFLWFYVSLCYAPFQLAIDRSGSAIRDYGELAVLARQWR